MLCLRSSCGVFNVAHDEEVSIRVVSLVCGCTAKTDLLSKTMQSKACLSLERFVDCLD